MLYTHTTAQHTRRYTGPPCACMRLPPVSHFHSGRSMPPHIHPPFWKPKTPEILFSSTAPSLPVCTLPCQCPPTCTVAGAVGRSAAGPPPAGAPYPSPPSCLFDGCSHAPQAASWLWHPVTLPVPTQLRAAPSAVPERLGCMKGWASAGPALCSSCWRVLAAAAAAGRPSIPYLHPSRLSSPLAPSLKLTAFVYTRPSCRRPGAWGGGVQGCCQHALRGAGGRAACPPPAASPRPRSWRRAAKGGQSPLISLLLLGHRELESHVLIWRVRVGGGRQGRGQRHAPRAAQPHAPPPRSTLQPSSSAVDQSIKISQSVKETRKETSAHLPRQLLVHARKRLGLRAEMRRGGDGWVSMSMAV